MKRNIKIFTLLSRYAGNPNLPDRIIVKIKGSTTGDMLYEGKIWDVPFKFCTDYVLSYRYAGGCLEIISTYRQYRDETHTISNKKL